MQDMLPESYQNQISLPPPFHKLFDPTTLSWRENFLQHALTHERTNGLMNGWKADFKVRLLILVPWKETLF
jgi:hypothetical protein